MRKIMKVLLCVFMISALVFIPKTVQASEQNLALNKPVKVSGIEGGTKEDGSLVYPQFEASNLTDGKTSTRWSSDMSLTTLNLEENPDQNVWAYVDLGENVRIGKIVLKWQSANSRNYDIQYSDDGQNWEVLKHYEDPENTGKEYSEVLELDEAVEGRYIRVYARLGTYIVEAKYQCPSISLYELEVYLPSNEPTLEKVLENVLNTTPSANEDYSQLILPATGDDDYTVQLYATSNPAVINTAGKITRPLEDMTVNLFYEVTDQDGNSLKGDDPQKVVIPGLYTNDEAVNSKPEVVPAIREWKGNMGNFTFTGNIIIADETLRDTAGQIAMYFEEMFNRKCEILISEPNVGDIYLKLDSASVLGKEGYALNINDTLEVSAKTNKGILYGGTTICQILALADDHLTVPKGLVRDYPQYEVRSIMLDVARQYIPLDYLEEITKYAGYFKLSEFRNHINDNGGEQGAAFRVESKKYPELNKGITAYSQEDYKEYQKAVKKFGVDVVTEIDTPAHAGAFGNIDPALLMDGYHLDLRTEETFNHAVTVMKDVFDEFLDGEDPVFQNSKFHIGTDEYDKSYSELVRKYMDVLINYVNSKDVDCRFWASLGSKGFAGTTPVSKDVIAHMWSHSWASFDEMKAEGYKFINNADGILYIVPFAGYYNDYLNIKNLYNNWEYSNLNGGYHLAMGHPQLLGAEACLWYDMKVGASEFDIFNRLRDQIMIIAEKGWSGEKTDENGDDFIQRVEANGKCAPQSNPARYVASNTKLVAAYDFDNVDNNIIKDLSDNGHDSIISGTYLKDGALRLNGAGYLALPFNSLGYPYTAQFDLTINSATPANALLFEGKDGKLFFNYDGTGKFGYERKGYTYLFDYKVPVNVKMTLTITCDETNATLYVNGVCVDHGEYYKVNGASKQASTTFVLPVEKIGAGIYGTLDNFKLYNYCMSAYEVAGIDEDDTTGIKNLALNKPVSVSGVEGGYNDDGELVYPQFNPQHATDGDRATRISLNRDDDAWVTIDLGKSYLIDEVKIYFGELPNAYAIYVSNDGEQWQKVDQKEGLPGGTRRDDSIRFNNIVNARYVKYQQLERFVYDGNGTKYSGNFNEFEVYGYELDKFENIISKAKELILSTEKTEENETFIAEIEKNVAKLEAMLKTGPVSDLDLLSEMVKKQLEMLEIGEIPSEIVNKDTLEQLLNENLDKNNYDSKTWKAYQQALDFGKRVLYNPHAVLETVEYAGNIIIETRNNLGMKKYVEITSNKSIYQDYELNRLIDNDTTSLTWLEGNQTAGQFILFTFRDVQKLSNIKIYSTNAGADIIHSGVVEISTDGTNWSIIGNIGEKEVEDLTFDETDARFVKISITKDASYWWKITEVSFNDQMIQDKEVLKKELENIIDATLYTEQSYIKYQKARQVAQEVYDDPAVNQIQIDAALDNLIVARENLEKVLDKTMLQNLIDNKEKEALYTVVSYQVYQDAYLAGKEVLEDENASQHDVDVAIWHLQEAIDNLVKAANKTALKIAVDLAQNIDGLDAVIPIVANEFIAALDEAKIILADPNAIQADVDASFTRLAASMHMLEFFKGNKETLQVLVDSVLELKETDYTKASWADLQTVLIEAKVVLVDENVMQEEVDTMVEKLTDAINSLVKLADKSRLQVLVDKVSDLDESKYLADTWTKFVEALTNANTVLDAQEPTQAEVDTAYNELVRTYLNLRLVPNKDILKDLINQAIALNEPALENIIIEAKAVLDNPNATQVQVDNAITVLNKAINGKVSSVETGDTLDMMAPLAGLIIASIALLKRKED